ncbi:MAG TPA: hypothetical protein DFR83_14000 [Deltaproteobacteria bacterium]|nr:hypothetical protein [Deltaproteobacteria bacterium]
MLLVSAGCTPDYDLQKEAEPEEGAEELEEAPEVDEEPEPEEIVDSGDTADGSGSAVPDPDLPVAVCDVSPNPVEPPFETATWDGSGSYDPEGHDIVDYSWALVSAPSGSSVRMPTGSDAMRGGFEPDLAGEYVGQLVVRTDDDRTSAPCQVTLQSIPAEDLWVEMFWQHSGDDMDLHMLAPGGTLDDRSTDCYFATCTGGMSWGASGTADDPYLDLDDIPGTGPENINIAAPSAGVYTVYVHDYPGSRYNNDNAVTVRVYINGTKLYDETKTINGEDDYTPFAAIDWSSGSVTPL